MLINHFHVAERYVERVLEVDHEEATEEMLERAIEHTKEAVRSPDTIYHGERESCPIHIKGDLAVPVDRSNGEVVVTTAYHADKFRGKLEDYVPA